jgi:hypothetical protein
MKVDVAVFYPRRCVEVGNHVALSNLLSVVDQDKSLVEPV